MFDLLKKQKTKKNNSKKRKPKTKITGNIQGQEDVR